MKFSISNIAWPVEHQAHFLPLIRRLGCEGLEIAADLVWSNPTQRSKQERLEFKRVVEDNGLSLCALQALLFGQKDLGLFKEKAAEQRTVEYLKSLCQLAADLGAKALVFGSPKNRERKNIPVDEAFERAADFFKKIAPTAENLGVYLCIEPLRRADTDFINTAAEGIKLIKMIDSPGIALHLDGATVSEESGDFALTIKQSVPYLKHFHISEPDLTELGVNKGVKHLQIAQALQGSGYDNFISIEMRKTDDCFGSVERSVNFVKEKYLNKTRAGTHR